MSTISCKGKQRFETRTLAAQICGRAREHDPQRMEPYHCHARSGWHVGHRNSRKHRMILVRKKDKAALRGAGE